MVVGKVFDEISFRKTGYETIFVFRENEGRFSRVSRFRETAEITKETIFAKRENRENEDNLCLNIKYNFFLFL
jgi:hypothetical protein